MHLSSASPEVGGGGNLGHMWGNQGLCGNFETNSNDAPTRGENVGTLLLARREDLGSKLCFRSIEEKNADVKVGPPPPLLNVHLEFSPSRRRLE